MSVSASLVRELLTLDIHTSTSQTCPPYPTGDRFIFSEVSWTGACTTLLKSDVEPRNVVPRPEIWSYCLSIFGMHVTRALCERMLSRMSEPVPRQRVSACAVHEVHRQVLQTFQFEA